MVSICILHTQTQANPLNRHHSTDLPPNVGFCMHLPPVRPRLSERSSSRKGKVYFFISLFCNFKPLIRLAAPFQSIFWYFKASSDRRPVSLLNVLTVVEKLRHHHHHHSVQKPTNVNLSCPLYPLWAVFEQPLIQPELFEMLARPQQHSDRCSSVFAPPSTFFKRGVAEFHRTTQRAAPKHLLILKKCLHERLTEWDAEVYLRTRAFVAWELKAEDKTEYDSWLMLSHKNVFYIQPHCVFVEKNRGTPALLLLSTKEGMSFVIWELGNTANNCSLWLFMLIISTLLGPLATKQMRCWYI